MIKRKNVLPLVDNYLGQYYDHRDHHQYFIAVDLHLISKDDIDLHLYQSKIVLYSITNTLQFTECTGIALYCGISTQVTC